MQDTKREVYKEKNKNQTTFKLRMSAHQKLSQRKYKPQSGGNKFSTNITAKELVFRIHK